MSGWRKWHFGQRQAEAGEEAGVPVLLVTERI